jgi:hypothetical protein
MHWSVRYLCQAGSCSTVNADISVLQPCTVGPLGSAKLTILMEPTSGRPEIMIRFVGQREKSYRRLGLSTSEAHGAFIKAAL